MHKKSYPSSPIEAKRFLDKRILAGLCLILVLICVLLAQIGHLQITAHQKYATLSKRNQVRLLPVPANRGLIYDSKGILLARNVPAFHLTLVPEQIQDLPALLAELHQVIPISPEQQQALFARISKSAKHQRQLLKLKLTEEEVSQFSVNQHRFPGVYLTVDLIRDYPYGPLLGHILGYVSEANKEDLSQVDTKRYAGTYQLGKAGLEKYYESLLCGDPGVQQIEADVMGRAIRTIATHPATNGQDLHLTLDLALQATATQALGENRGAIVALDPNNGAILAMVSTPNFDPNLFVKGLDNQTYQTLRTTPSRPLFNRAIQGQYPPGSTVKPIVGLAGLETQKMLPQYKLFDEGFYQIKGNERLYRDWKRQGHGWTDFEKAMRESCDVYYYILSEKLTAPVLSQWFGMFGLGHASGIDLPNEQKGLVPSLQWKKQTLGETWYPGETLIMGIGQGYMLATPLQLATVAVYLANKGIAFRPHFNSKIKPEALPSLEIKNTQYWNLLIHSMRQVAQHPTGTAHKAFHNAPFDIACKTGTSQVFGLKKNEQYVHDKVAAHLRDHSLFIGFAPVKNPKIAIAVILENQKGSAYIARTVIESYLTGKYHVAENTLPHS